jgi:carboxypeptidase C (cathepsin A)
MKPLPFLLAVALSASAAVAARAQSDTTALTPMAPMAITTEGSVHTAAGVVSYQAVLGKLVVHARGWDDAAPKDDTPEATMSYVAYFKTGADAAKRPLTFLFNGGPGSSTVWLHMGAFGPRRVVTADHTHTPGPPYQIVDNEESLLDVSDLVFVDAPGTGFGRIRGKDKEKAFYGVDQDIHAFAAFISEFLSTYDRWNSPRYLFGESYGTMRGAGLPLALEGRDIDLNGVMLLSCILDWDMMPDNPELNPSIDEPYEVSLPTYAATAWYHHKLPNAPSDLAALLEEVEHFAMTDYAEALAAGSTLPADQRHAIAEKLHQYTGLPVAYIEKADLRINGGEFEKTLMGEDDTTTGRLDTRFSGPTLDPLSKEAGYDPQSAAISSAYVAAFNDYVRKDLKYGADLEYKPEIRIWRVWNSKHQPPGAHQPMPQAANVMPDLANAMKQNPTLKVLLNAGYFDLATPFFEGVYEMHHLPIPAKLQDNIEFKFYKSGHMVYAHEESLKELHDNVAAFIRKTDNLKNP